MNNPNARRNSILIDTVSTHTKTTIRLHRMIWADVERYFVWECAEHGDVSPEFDNISQAIRLTRDSREWCVGCGAGRPVAGNEA